MSTKTTTSKDSRWRPLIWILPASVILLGLAVLGAQWLRGMDGVQAWMERYPGATPLPEDSPEGFPAWLGWQHFLNAFLMVLIIRTGWLVRTTARPKANWTRNNKGPIKTKRPPKKISMDLWLHYVLDVLWILNGVIFVILLIVSGRWVRVVPTSWEVFPNAASAALQYLSLNWPHEDSWVNYNSLQVLTYFVVIFIASPLAAITGLRMSNIWPEQAKGLNKAYPVELARAIHFPVMLFFVLFIVVHVTLVFTTGALQNLNYVYAAQNSASSWLGFWMFAASLVVMVAGWFLSRPIFTSPIANTFGRVSR